MCVIHIVHARVSAQARCLGVYTILKHQQHNEQPMWRHTSEDLALVSTSNKEGWMVCNSLTLAVKEQVCMKVESSPWPWSVKGATWSEFAGRDWAPVSSVTCRPSYHGWGHDGGDGWQTSKETSYHDACVLNRRHRTGKSPPGSPA